MDRLTATFAIPIPVKPSTTVYWTASGITARVYMRIAHSVIPT